MRVQHWQFLTVINFLVNLLFFFVFIPLLMFLKLICCYLFLLLCTVNRPLVTVKIPLKLVTTYLLTYH